MKRAFPIERIAGLAAVAVAWTGIIVSAAPASAAPGDAVAVSGTLQLERGRGVVVRGDNGATYVADLARTGRGDLQVGERIILVGREGYGPGEIVGASVEPVAGRGGAVRGDVAAGEVVVIDGWALPRSHIYQVQDDRGVYYQIQPVDIPGQIIRGKEVYDLTARAWVNHPTAFAAWQGRNPAYMMTSAPIAAPPVAGDVFLADGWRLPVGHIYQVQDDRGVYYQIRPPDIPGQILRGKEVYDLTAQAWVNHPTAYAATGGRNPAYTATPADYARHAARDGRDAARLAGDWQEMRGWAERVDGRWLTLRTDDGWSFAVDLSDVDIAGRRVRAGDRVVVVGSSSGGRFIARQIAWER